MSGQRSWDPFSEMLTLRDAMGQLLEGSFVRPGTGYAGPSQAGYSFPIYIHGCGGRKVDPPPVWALFGHSPWPRRRQSGVGPIDPTRTDILSATTTGG